MDLKAHISDSNRLTIFCNGNLVSDKLVPNDEHWGSFSWGEEKIQYQFNRSDNEFSAHQVHFYPINLPYKQNPITVKP